MIDSAYLIHWLTLQGVSADVPNKEGRLPQELLQQGSLGWKYIQKTMNTGKHSKGSFIG